MFGHAPIRLAFLFLYLYGADSIANEELALHWSMRALSENIAKIGQASLHPRMAHKL